ncbi:MAG: fluoride efflux transporter CrcB [Pseudonocardia sp.]
MSNEVDRTEPVAPDVTFRARSPRRELLRVHVPVLVVISFGGGLGAAARYGLALLLPTRPDQFPWGTFTVNVVGCLLIGVLMVLITDVWSAHRLVRPFLGVGILGGFTTFSTYAVEIRNLLHPGSVGVAFGYLAGTLIGAMLAVLVGMWLTRTVTRSTRERSV